jgi:hypothetical protein
MKKKTINQKLVQKMFWHPCAQMGGFWEEYQTVPAAPVEN